MHIYQSSTTGTFGFLMNWWHPKNKNIQILVTTKIYRDDFIISFLSMANHPSSAFAS